MKYVVLFVLITALSLAGCSSEQKTNDNKPGIIESTTQTVTSLSVLKEIEEIASKGATASYVVTYDMDYGEGQKSEVTTYYQNKDKIRVDSISTDYEVKSYFVDGTATMCTKQDAKFTCLTVKPEEKTNPADVKIDITEYESELDTEDSSDSTFKVYKDGTITVTGHIANCYKMESSDGYQRYCFSKEGVMLYTKIVDPEGNSEMLAKSYSTTVTDSDFEIPKDAEMIDLNQDLANIQQQYGGQVQEMENLGGCYDDCDATITDPDELESCYAVCLEN